MKLIMLDLWVQLAHLVKSLVVETQKLTFRSLGPYKIFK